jgi:prolyl-tRNA synthetase
MKFTNLFGKTLRDDQRDADNVSYNLLLRAGYIRQLASGIFSYLHFGQRSLKKIEQILREEMNAIGGDEICMPVVHPAEIWQKTNRWYDIDDSLVRFKDRNDRDMVLAMTHEEVVANLASSEIDTYKQLPKLVYQMFTKFRDEPRSRGGLIRVREFTMKDSYSLDRDVAGLEKQYIAHYNSYFRIFARTGLPAIAIQSDTGMMGGRVAHEYMYIAPIGEDTIFICEKSGYKANKEVATVRKVYKDIQALPLEKVHTPNKKTIAELATFLDASEDSFAKMVFFSGIVGGERKVVVAVVRGDMEANPIKVQKLSGADKMQAATEAEISDIGAVAGYASPMNIDKTKAIVIVDDLVARTNNLVVGANEADYHYKNACYGRDYEADMVGDIISAYDGALCPISDSDDAVLQSVRGVEIGNIFQLGTKYTAALDAFFTDEDGTKKPIVMGSYGIGVGRLLSCLCEEHFDIKGLCLPISVAPYHVVIVALIDSPEIEIAATQLYHDLRAAGIEVIYDDREGKVATAGIKFSDADLIGFPIRLTVSKRSLLNGGVEFKMRRENESSILSLDQVIPTVKDKISLLFNELKEKADTAETWK